jgi:ubiquinone biosynthesis protein
MRLSAHHLKRYKDIAKLVLKHRRAARRSRFGQETAESATDGELHEAEELPDDLENLGPTFVKLGQLLSSRVDLLPPVYLKPLERLQNKVAPFPFSEVAAVVEAELGMAVDQAFLRFEREPLAAASLGQVHRAVLPDGRAVAVKVQRPNIARQIEQDFEALEAIAGLLERHTQAGQRYELHRILEEFEETLAHELDYHREASNMVTLAQSLKSFPHLKVPLPIPEFTTRRVLTMNYIDGCKITELSHRPGLEPDGSMLVEELFQAYLQQILVDGIFHADPHPGNIHVTSDGCIALLDLGMIGRTSPGMQEHLLKLLLAISEGHGEEAAQVAVRLSHPKVNFDAASFDHKITQLVAQEQHSTLRQMNTGSLVLKVGRIAAVTGLDVPPELTLLGKTLLQLDQVGRILAPQFDPNAAIRRHGSRILHERLKSSLTEGKVFSTLLEAKEFFSALPARLNRILDAVGAARLKVDIKPSETEFLVESARKVANRITTGLILAALIVGAALLMRVQTSVQILGYPALAILLFLAAAAGGIWLILSILWSDHNSKQRSRRPR